MKKLIAIILASILLLSISVSVLADGTTTLTTTVPAATYTLNIPADQEITFGATSTKIGQVTVSNAKGFAESKNLQVTVSYDAFSCDSVSTTIPYVIKMASIKGADHCVTHQSGESITFFGNSSGSVDYYLYDNMYIEITSADWGKALAGEYSSTITFTSEVVSSEN
ncbi:MAG: hypothetical protein IKV39_04255 [Clostridia bacterium]|nr:hypothetical protein [Clostridia bacterium]